MRTPLTLLALLATLALGVPTLAAEWHHDLDDALEDAGSCDGEILLDVYTTWCGPCRRLVSEVFNTELFAEAAAGMVLAKVDAESGNGPEVARRYAVVGYPTVLILDLHGNEIDRLFGFLDAETFAARLREIRYGVPTVSQFLSLYSAPHADEIFAMSFERGFGAASCGHYDVADRLLETLVELDGDNSTGFASSALLILGKYRHLRGAHDPDTALTYFERIIREFPESSEVESAIVQSGIAHARAGRATESLQSFEAYLSIDPEDADRANAVAFSMARESIALDRAQAIAEHALESSPDDDSLWDTLAEVHFANGDFADAIAAIDQAIARSSDPAYYREQRARFESRE
ncbi:MAG: thioredoxin-like negative regulator of GroEL [Bradymonadia bacterium]|jgi:thioredoxin-like negative regulator of GroEL